MERRPETNPWDRILVATPPLAAGEPPLAVGALREGGRITLIAKAAFSFAADAEGRIAGRVVPVAEPARLCLATPSALPGAREGELEHPSDFVPRKADTDVLLVGHAYAERPVSRIEASIELDGLGRAFAAVRGTPSERIPLSADHLREAGSEDRTLPVGPVPIPPRSGPRGADFDFAHYNSAAPDQRVPIAMAGSHVVLEGLSRHARRRVIELPDIAPRAAIEAGEAPAISIDMVCDTVEIDTDREILTLVWRGSAPGGRIDRAVVWWSHAGAPRDREAATRELGRGAFVYAVEERDLAEGARGADGGLEEAALLLAKYAAWEDPPGPAISIEQYAAISAELQEGRERRGEVLRRHGLGEDAWALEEHAWLAAMADGASKGDASLAGRYGELFLAAQDALEAPAEAARSLDDYVPLKAAMARGGDPSKLLAQRGMTLSEWMRLDRRFTAAARADARLAAEIDRRVDEAAGAMGPIDDDEAIDHLDDDDEEAG